MVVFVMEGGKVAVAGKEGVAVVEIAVVVVQIAVEEIRNCNCGSSGE